MTDLTCPRCGSDEISGGYVICNHCGKEWHPDEPSQQPEGRLLAAARAVIANWENGDLAAAVRELAAAVKLA